GAVNTVQDINERYGVGSRDVVLGLSSLSFDLSVYDVFGVLGAGGTLVLPEAGRGRDPEHWLSLMRRHGVSIWNSVPALLQMLVQWQELEGEGLGERLRLVLLSGDWIPVSLPDEIRKLAPAACVVSLGGASEASVWSNLFEVAQVEPSWKSIPYGHGMRNQQLLVLDQRLAPRATWVTGDIYLGGVGLAQGYWADAAQTAERFLTHPRTGQRLYRTGDLGRYREDGEVEFLGRADTQVKLQGYRVELGEIESVLRAHSLLREAVVLVQGERGGLQRLIAYLVPEPEAAGDAILNDQAFWRDYLSLKLPHYMIPNLFLSLDHLPLSANGKVDRSALPTPERAQAASER